MSDFKCLECFDHAEVDAGSNTHEIDTGLFVYYSSSKKKKKPSRGKTYIFLFDSKYRNDRQCAGKVLLKGCLRRA